MDSPFDSMSNFAVASSKKEGKPATDYMEKIARQCGKDLVYNKRGRIVEKNRSEAALLSLKKNGLTKKQMQLKKTGSLTKKRMSPARKSPARKSKSPARKSKSPARKSPARGSKKSPKRKASASSSRGSSASPARRRSARVNARGTR